MTAQRKPSGRRILDWLDAHKIGPLADWQHRILSDIVEWDGGVPVPRWKRRTWSGNAHTQPTAPDVAPRYSNGLVWSDHVPAAQPWTPARRRAG